MQYYISIDQDQKEIVRRMQFEDYCAAIAYFGRYYKPRSQRSVLEFTTEVINGEFARSYVTLQLPGDVAKDDAFSDRKYHIAVKQSNAFEYKHSYHFLVESEIGVVDADSGSDE